MALTVGQGAPAGGASWLKTGQESAQVAKQDQVEAEQRKAEQGKMWRFYLKDGEEARITFVDGDLSPEGFLLPPRYYEHNLMLNGKWGNTFVCPEKTLPDSGEKCPICESGDRPSLVAVFTIIDHRTVKSKDGTKTYKDLPRLFVAKGPTFELLNKLAQKRGGLAGTTWDAMRAGDKSASVGSAFDFVEKVAVEELRKKYVHEVTDPKTNQKTIQSFFVPANYEHEIVFRTGDQLRQMGLGKPSSAPASGFGGYGGGQPAGDTDYSTKL